MSDAAQLQRVVREDLSYLRQNWDRETTDVELRITGTVLRRLLVEGLLQRAWRSVGLQKQPLVHAPDLDQMLAAVANDQEVLFALAGGPEVQGACARFMARWAGEQLRLRVPQEEFQRRVTTDVEFALGAYVDGPCIYAWGTRVNRRELVLYVCNKLGGAHLDSSRHDRHEHAFRLLDQLFDAVHVAQHRGIYYEFLSIGRTLCASSDITRLAERL